MRIMERTSSSEYKGNIPLFYISLYAGLLLLPSALSADDAIQGVMCNIVLATVGTTGKAICTVNVIAMGVGALLGKISWAKAMILVAAIGMVFGAVSIVETLGYNDLNSHANTEKTGVTFLPSPVQSNSCTQSSIVYN